MATALVKFQDICSPISGTFRGVRVLASTPNRAGRNPYNGAPCPSFDKPYLITWFGDYCNTTDLVANFPKVVTTLKRLGYSDLNII